MEAFAPTRSWSLCGSGYSRHLHHRNKFNHLTSRDWELFPDLRIPLVNGHCSCFRSLQKSGENVPAPLKVFHFQSSINPLIPSWISRKRLCQHMELIPKISENGMLKTNKSNKYGTYGLMWDSCRLQEPAWRVKRIHSSGKILIRRRKR